MEKMRKKRATKDRKALPWSAKRQRTDGDGDGDDS
jgi:hypothetical protein